MIPLPRLQRAHVAIAVILLLVAGGIAAPGAGVDPGSVRDAVAELTTPKSTAEMADESDGQSGYAFTFERATDRAGFTYTTGKNKTNRRQMLSDVGVYVGDVNGDRWPDLLTTGGDGGPALFVNKNGSFARASGLPPLNRSVRSALFFDYNDDGRTDLLLLSDSREPLLLRNTGAGNFRRAQNTGFRTDLQVPIGATTGDYNRDGCLDLFVIQNGEWSDHIPKAMSAEHVPISGDNGLPNVLYRGTCSGFERVEDAGINGTRWSLATSFVDFDDDGLPDIHVANDFNDDILYHNRGNGTFEQIPLGNVTDRNAMSSEIADVNRDGRPDIFVTNIYYPEMINETLETRFSTRSKGNNLLINRGNLTFEDEAGEYGVRKGGWGWAAVIADLDNDGDQDLYHATMHRTFSGPWSLFDAEEVQTIRRQYPYFRYPVVRERNATGFTRANAVFAGIGVHDGTGVGQLDVDRDGDLDLAVANRTGPFQLYKNDVQKHCQGIELSVSTATGRPALGATVTVVADGTRQTRFLTSRTDFLSQDSRVLHFGTGGTEAVDVRISWPDGTTRRYENVSTGQYVTIVRDRGVTEEQPFTGCGA